MKRSCGTVRFDEPPNKKFGSRDTSCDYSTEDAKKQRSPMSLFKMKIHEAFLKVIDHAIGDFAIYGQLENAPTVVISMKEADKKKLHFPLYEEEAEKIIPYFELSPFGKGSKTVVDTSVRNSLQLDSHQFEILNPDWKFYVNEVLVPRIGKEMCIRTSFKATLNKALLYQTGSFFKSHRVSEKDIGMFAMLVIQLPSKYKGGQLVVNHDGKYKPIDFSSSEFDSNAFRTFFSCFYCDCEHELIPVTEGFRFCLVYNLIAEDTNIPVPSVSSVLEMELKSIFFDWTIPRKIVYALKHRYSESSLSLANLKTSDKAVANILKCLSGVCGLDIYLAIFEKDVEGQGDGTGSNGSDDFDTDDECFLEKEEYGLYSLLPISASTAASGLFMRNVDFGDEVIPEDCFGQMKPYHKRCNPTGNEGVHVSKSYMTCAIVFWPRRFTVDILRKSDTPSNGLTKYFLEEVRKFQKDLIDEETQQKVLNTASSALMSNFGDFHEVRSELTIPVLKALVGINDLKLIQKFLEQCVKLNASILPLLSKTCENLGWQFFSVQWISMFLKANTNSLENSPALLNMLIKDGLENEKFNICRKILETILDSLNDNTGTSNTSTTSSYYNRRGEQEKFTKLAKLNEDPEILYSLFYAARKLNYDLFEFMKNKTRTNCVQVLIKLAKATGPLTDQWAKIGNHFVPELEKHIATKSSILLYGRQITPWCNCRDCKDLIAFLEGNDQSIQYYSIPKQRLIHLQLKINNIKDLKYEEDEYGWLTVHKTRQTGQDLIDACNTSIELLDQLRSVL